MTTTARAIPRWEWRAFGAGFGPAEAPLAAMDPEKVQESDETYLLSPVTDANVKIRDGLMDVKALEGTAPSGLERWRPVMKGSFPLPGDDVIAVCDELGIDPPASGRDAFALDDLLADLAQRGVRVVAIHKRRRRYTINGCLSELTDVTADGKPVRTVAIESEDADRVLAAVRELGLSGLKNTSYPRALKALLGMKR